jgi:integrase
MPRPSLPNLHRERTRHGKMIWVHRVGHGKRTPIWSTWGTPEFLAAYRAAALGQPVVGKRQVPGETVKWLIDLYRASPAWAKLKPATRKGRETVLDHLVTTVGDRLVDDLTREEIEKRMATKTVSMANLTLNTLRTLFAWAIEAKHVEENPAAAVRYLKNVRTNPDDEDGHKTWTEADLAQFEAAYPLGTVERLAYSVILYTGLRVGDAARLGRQHVQKDGTIQIRTEKTGETVYLPILAPLRQALDAGPHGRPGELAFITGPRGHAWGKAHLGDQFAEAAEKAGLVDCTAHGLRKASATRCAEAAATVNQMMAMFGWKRPDMAIKYTFAASKKLMAADAAKGLVRA